MTDGRANIIAFGSQMKTIYFTAGTLDGFIADTEQTLSWLLQFGNAGNLAGCLLRVHFRRYQALTFSGSVF